MVQELNELLVVALHGRAKVRPQMSFAASELSEPEPDLTIAPLGPWDSEQANQAYVIIEVAEFSLAIDRGRKRRLYASCGVPEYWIVNLPERCIEVYTRPDGNAYAQVERFEPGQAIQLGAFPDVEVRVSSLDRHREMNRVVVQVVVERQGVRAARATPRARERQLVVGIAARQDERQALAAFSEHVEAGAASK